MQIKLYNKYEEIQHQGPISMKNLPARKLILVDSLDIVDELSANGLHEKSCYGLLAHDKLLCVGIIMSYHYHECIIMVITEYEQPPPPQHSGHTGDCRGQSAG